MLHEVFLALFGHESSLFCSNWKCEEPGNLQSSNVSENCDNSRIISNQICDIHKISSSIENVIGSSHLFHPCEVRLISEILQVAEYYKRIVKFYERVFSFHINVSNLESDNEIRNGFLLTTFATSVYDETKSYQKKIVALEAEYLESSTFLPSLILLEISPFRAVFIELCHLIDVVEKRHLHGCKILDFLHKQCILSVGEIQQTFIRIRESLQDVLIEQLTHWVLYGALLDPYKELFLTVRERTQPEEGSATARKHFLRVSEGEVEIDVKMLPDFIPLPAAEKILFIGEAIVCFERSGGAKGTGIRFFVGEDESRFLKQFQSAAVRKSFPHFLELIETSRLCATKHLYTLVMEEGLQEQLSNFKDIFLLGRGELFQAFFILCRDKKPNTNVNALFQRAGRQVMMADRVLDKFLFTWEEELPSAPAKGNLWKNLRIDINVEWPLHKFFDWKVQQQYKAILRFLLNIRHAQLRLQALWVSQKNTKSQRLEDIHHLSSWQLRHHMNLLISSIQNYIQVDVLESSYDELREEMLRMDDYQHLCFEHQKFLAAITSQCFLNHPTLHKAIVNVIEKVDTFCTLLENPTHDDASFRAQMKALKEDYDTAASHFFWALNSLGRSRSCQHTLQLVTRIDYNKYYSRSTNKRY